MIMVIFIFMIWIFEAMGTTTCMQIDLNKLFKGGFSTGHGHLREPKRHYELFSTSSNSYQSNQNDQHGGTIYTSI